MIIAPRDVEYLVHLAEQIEAGDYFEKNVRTFRQEVELLKDRIYQQSDNPDILDLADSIPTIELQPYRRSFLEQLLPKAGRDMVGRYKTKELIREQVRETISRLKEILRYEGDSI